MPYELHANTVEERCEHTRDRHHILKVNGRALPGMLMPGDVIAIYAGSADIVSWAAVESFPAYDQFTPRGCATILTSGGRFDIPRTSRVDVLAWRENTGPEEK